MPAFYVSYCRVTAMTECPAKTTYRWRNWFWLTVCEGKAQRQELKQEVTLCLQSEQRGKCKWPAFSFVLHSGGGAAHETVLPTARVHLLPQVQSLWKCSHRCGQKGVFLVILNLVMLPMKIIKEKKKWGKKSHVYMHTETQIEMNQNIVDFRPWVHG